MKGVSRYPWEGKLEKIDIGLVKRQSRRQQCDVTLVTGDEGRELEVCIGVRTIGIACVKVRYILELNFAKARDDMNDRQLPQCHIHRAITCPLGTGRIQATSKLKAIFITPTIQRTLA